MTQHCATQNKGISQTASLQEQTEESAFVEQKVRQSLNKLGFIDKGSGEHQSNQVWGTDANCPTVPSISWKEPLKVVDK